MADRYLEHLTHGHPLRRRDALENEEEFLCDGCNMFGSAGVRYECSKHKCNFNLHEECATCPTYLSTHIHPLHKLELNWEEPDNDDQVKNKTVGIGIPRHCNVCGEQVQKGLYYTCPSCDYFFIHPICTKFPERIRHVKDTKHDLTFQSASDSLCAICGYGCTSWRYRCGICRIDIHLECVTTPVLPSSSPTAPPSPHVQLHRSVSSPVPMMKNYYVHDHHHQQQQQQKSPPPSTNTNLGGGYYAVGVPAYSPPPYDMYHHHHHNPIGYGPPAYGGPYQQGGSGPAATSSSSSSSSGSTGRKRRMFAIVARIAVTVAVGAAFGVPLPLI